MKTGEAMTTLEVRAAEALRALLGQISGVKLKEMRRESPARQGAAGILAYIDVFGHSHTLACEVNCDGEPCRLRAELRDFLDGAAHLPPDTTPVIIAPYLSPEAQALCKENRAGFLDLEGNARLSVGELFIGMRSLPCRREDRPSVPSPGLRERSTRRGPSRSFSANHANAVLTA